MGWTDRLELRLGRFAIPGVVRILVGFEALVYLLLAINPGYKTWLLLDQDAILAGQVWRLFTFLFLPTAVSPFIMLFKLWVTWFIGDALEHAWGAFKLNLFVFLSVLGTVIAAFAFDVSVSNFLLVTTLFLAFATVYPDVEFYLFFILPVKAKWLGVLDAVLLVYLFVIGSLAWKLTILLSIINYLIFFGPSAIRAALFKGQTAVRRSRFDSAVREAEVEAIHLCKVCGRTDATNPELDFRIATDGEEYCTEHLPARSQPR